MHISMLQMPMCVVLSTSVANTMFSKESYMYIVKKLCCAYIFFVDQQIHYNIYFCITFSTRY